VASSLARVRELLAASHGVERARPELGVLGATRIDAGRFAELSHTVKLDAMARARIAHAASILRDCVDASDDDFAILSSEGRTSHDNIANALARWGSAFGSALVVDLIRLGQYVASQHDRLAEVWPFEHWSRAHRQAAPPIVAVVSASDLRGADLSEFLDGAQHIVLVIDGECAPGCLVRYITPGTLVLQTSDERGFDRFAAYEGPAIAAIVPETAARFLHDPDAGTALWQRLTIWQRPAGRLRSMHNGLSAAQQREELLQLEALATPPALPDTAIEALVPSGSGDVADRLAIWLLAQSGASGPS
jgi:hypothetical protein